MSPNRSVDNAVLKSFLNEDIGFGDITTESLLEPSVQAEGQIICKEQAVLAGIEEAVDLLRLVGCETTAHVPDGHHVKPKTVILNAQGPARSLLGVERTVLNLLSHMSGVATATAELVSIVAKASDNKVKVACTRKTIPGLRLFQKKAVQLGGGDTHRLRLDDAVLIKDNHLAFSDSIAYAVRTAKARVSFTKKVEVEATSPDQVSEAAHAGADIILLDNMTARDVAKSIASLKAHGFRDKVLVEASGGITRENIASYAKSGVDVVSVGAITHSVKAIDMSMEIKASKNR